MEKLMDFLNRIFSQKKIMIYSIVLVFLSICLDFQFGFSILRNIIVVAVVLILFLIGNITKTYFEKDDEEKI